MRRLHHRKFLCLLFAAAAFGETGGPPPPPPSEADALLKLGQRLFEEFAPPEVKAQFEFPTKERWDEFAARLQRALESDSLTELGALLPEARGASQALRLFSGYQDYADWLEQRIDEIEIAQQLTSPPPPTPPPPTP
ncbi:MAG: hypothetical protein ABIR80_21105, partial [Opitutaceae bacterium]